MLDVLNATELSLFPGNLSGQLGHICMYLNTNKHIEFVGIDVAHLFYLCISLSICHYMLKTDSFNYSPTLEDLF